MIPSGLLCLWLIYLSPIYIRQYSVPSVLSLEVEVQLKWLVHRFVFSLLGSLVMEHPGEASTPFQGCILFGTVNGTIGEMFSLLPPIDFTVSSLIQKCKRILRCDDLVLPQISIMRYEVARLLLTHQVDNFKYQPRWRRRCISFKMGCVIGDRVLLFCTNS